MGGQRILLKVSDVARMLSVCRATVYALLDRGELERIWVGNSIRVTTASVDQLIARGR